MVASMTAFARKQQEFDWGSMSWEIRSVNHRFLEPGIRLPDNLRGLEPIVRETLRKAVNRGKVDVQLRIQYKTETPTLPALNSTLVSQLSTLSSQVQSLCPEAQPLRVSDVLRWPGVLDDTGPDDERLQADALKLLQDTLLDFIESRQREGEELSLLILQRLRAIRDIVQSIRQRLPEILARQQDNIRARLDSLKQELDPARLEQEIVLLAHKSDVDEELDRLLTHVAEVERVLKTAEPIGRRLDFLMQELNREANTLSSKSIVAETTLSAVELKVLIEQMREQIQNIE
ncbi:MAG TPA: YicC/YloC family endoribonuclease [Pseudohongiella sp.]|nr:YicC/YloC family endoribonuclease [Pseudohongiella sp.]